MSLDNLTDDKTRFININKNLNEHYGYYINYSSDLKELSNLCGKILESSRKDNSIFETFNSHNYRKASLIQEAVKLFLSEVKIGRTKKKRGSKK